MALSYEYLTGVYTQVPVESFLLTDRLGKVKEYSPIPSVKIRIDKSGMSVATLGKLGDPARPVNVSPNVSEVSYTPPEIFEYYVVTEDDVFNIVNPKIISVTSEKDVVSNIEYVAAKVAAELKNRVTRRIELMFAQILSEGKITYSDGNRSLTYDFGITATDYTLTDTTNVASDLIDMADEMRRNGANPDLIIITPNVEKAMLSNNQIQQWANKNGFGLLRTNIKVYKTARQTFNIDGLPADIFVYVGGYADDSGDFKYYIPFDESGGTGKIILVDSSFFRLAYGALVNYKINPDGRPIRGEAVVWEDVTNNGASKAIFVQSRPLPYVASSAAVKILNVTIS